MRSSIGRVGVEQPVDRALVVLQWVVDARGGSGVVERYADARRCLILKGLRWAMPLV